MKAHWFNIGELITLIRSYSGDGNQRKVETFPIRVLVDGTYRKVKEIVDVSNGEDEPMLLLVLDE